MSEEKIDFKIEAEDNATAKVRKSREEIERQVETVNKLGGQARESATHVEDLANLFGADFSSYTNEIRNITDRLNEYTETVKQGVDNTAMLKAGLIANGIQIRKCVKRSYQGAR